MEDDFVEVEKNATITRDLDSLGLESMPAHVEGSASPSAPADSASPSQKDTDSNSSVSGTISALQFLKTHPFVKSTLEDKVYGCIVGSALGDTIGLYTEFLPKAACESAYPDRRFSLTDPVTEPYQDQHRQKFERGSWTDDTDQSLLIILAYLHERSIDKLPDSFARRLHIWISHGLLALDRLPCGIGKLVGSTVTSANYLQNPEVAAIGQWVKTGCNIAPNGSLMRTHPIGIIAIDMSEPDAFKLAAKVGRTTHVDPRCTLSCCVVVGVIRGILRGDIVDDQTLNDTIERAYTWVSTQPTLLSPAPESRTKEIDRVEFERHAYAASYEDLHLDDRMSIGYVYKCLGSSLLVLRRGIALSSSSKPPPKALFESLITDLVMEGGDADTNATVAGGLLGAWLGYARLPERWVDGLRHCDWLVHKTYRLIVALGIEDGKVNAEDDEKPEGPKGLLSDEELKKREIDLITRLLEQQNKVRQEKEKRERRGPFFGSRLFKDW